MAGNGKGGQGLKLAVVPHNKKKKKNVIQQCSAI
jgi:hypothetical protein